jgi:hypothetical protein
MPVRRLNTVVSALREHRAQSGIAARNWDGMKAIPMPKLTLDNP